LKQTKSALFVTKRKNYLPPSTILTKVFFVKSLTKLYLMFRNMMLNWMNATKNVSWDR